MASTDYIFPVGKLQSQIVQFVSLGRTGTGAAETIPHHLPGSVFITSVQQHSGNGAVTVAAADRTNAFVTVTNGVVYDLCVECIA